MKSKQTGNVLNGLTRQFPPFKFVSEVQSELQKVTWPTREKVLRMSVLVIAACVIFGLYLGGLDLAFTSLMKYIVDLRN